MQVAPVANIDLVLIERIGTVNGRGDLGGILGENGQKLFFRGIGKRRGSTGSIDQQGTAAFNKLLNLLPLLCIKSKPPVPVR